MLSKRGGQVVAGAIDTPFAPPHLPSLKTQNLTIVTADALSLDWTELIESSKAKVDAIRGEEARLRVRIVANLPYYISTPIIEKLLSCAGLLFDMTLMLQKEVADRIAAEPGG